MIAVVLAAMAGVGIMVANVNVPVSDEKKLVDENRISISTHVENIEGGVRSTRVVVIPNSQLKECDGANCHFAWGEQTMKRSGDSRLITTLELDLKALECNLDKETGSAKCVQRVTPLTDSEWELFSLTSAQVGTVK